MLKDALLVKTGLFFYRCALRDKRSCCGLDFMDKKKPTGCVHMCRKLTMVAANDG